MSQPTHTYGQTCRLARTVAFSNSKGDDDMPPLKAQFFYSSSLPIDDPLSVVPIPTGSETKSTSHPPRPFSAYDNSALEDGWLGLGTGKEKKQSKASSSSRRDREHDGHDSERRTKSLATTDAPNTTGGRLDSSSTKVPATFEKYSSRQARTEAKAARAAPPITPGKPDSELGASPRPGDGAADGENDAKQPKDSRSSKRDKSSARGKASNQEAGKEENRRETYPAATSSPSCCTHLEAQRDASEETTSSPFCCNHLEGQMDTSEEPVTRGNPYNRNCDDPHHAYMDSPVPNCCNYMEDRVEHVACVVPADGSALQDSLGQSSIPEVTKRRRDKSKSRQSARQEVEEAQGDAADDKLSHVSLVNMKHYGSWEEEHCLGTAPLLVPVQGGGAGTTGLPFIKFPSPNEHSRPPVSDAPAHGDRESKQPEAEHVGNHPVDQCRSQERGSMETETVEIPVCKAQKNSKVADVPVGISRLHLVKLPALQMQPIYWSPINDVATVTRGTWFYKDSMCPVEPTVANQLEMGYRELRPWSQTWNDELNSAMEVGAAGEEKIAHRLWPDENKISGSYKKNEHPISADPYCAARCFHGEAAAEGTAGPDGAVKPSNVTTISKKYSNAQVIYKDAQNAFVLKPTLQPSAYYGRKPLQKIKKGTAVGIHVIRGFDWKLWEKLHPSNRTKASAKAEGSAPAAVHADAGKRNACEACRSQEERPKVTDLVLVIHGIGQKLASRMETFHFTHSINAFRRSVNVELGNAQVQRVLRNDVGVMVLPVNWRSNLSFEDGGPMQESGDDHTKDDFTLEDITQKTIPVVRNLISDVMLDIPYYMSHHKGKMIEAVIQEANRVYRLWCKNNPDFHRTGRVHIIAHSLGSVMCLDILSKQPTTLPKVDLQGKKINAKCFDFCTTNLFFVGSPAGFFLLLEKRMLLPRRGQSKPGAEQGDETDKAITGVAGEYGCLAVDNIYNVMSYNDPIAYCLNATVDSQYAKSLKNAQVPSATTGFFESIGNAMRAMTPGASVPVDLAVGQVAKPPSVARLPFQLEMEVHDFTREEIAEKKFYLLNDNGQMDWLLNSGGGPLEIQYLNMLSAHSSYWIHPDFVRMLVIEVGRKAGKSYCLPNMRAVKATQKK